MLDFTTSTVVTIENAEDFADTANDWERKRIASIQDSGLFRQYSPNAVVEKGKKYYSRDREAYIQTDVSIEKYFSTQDEISPGLIIIIECKDYKDKYPQHILFSLS